MKKIAILALAFVALTGCQKSLTTPTTDDGLVPILLSTKVNTEATTKGPITPTTTDFNPTIAAWEAGQTAQDYTQATSWTYTSSINLTNASSIATGHNYSGTETTYTHLLGWHPQGTVSNGKVTLSPNAFNDIMISDPVSGNKNTQSPLALSFHHKASQVYFTVKSSDAAYTPTINSIQILGATLATGFDFTDKSALKVVWSPATTDVSVNGSAQQISDTGATYGFPVMIKPFSGKTFNIKVVLADGTVYNSAQVTLDTTQMEIGVAYNVTLTFNKPAENPVGISVAVTVDAWKDGTGSATLG